MTHDEIFAKVTAIMREAFEDGDLAPAPDATADDIDAWDSINHVTLIVALENEFAIRFEPEEITAPQNFGELVALVESKLSR